MTELSLKLREILMESGRARDSDLIGCSDNEIAAVEQQLDVRLPEEYTRFLRAMGNGAANFQTDAMWQLKYIENIRKDVLEALNPETHQVVHFKLSDEMFVFLESDGSQFLFFYPAAGDDPPVFLYEAPDENASQIADSFSGWIQKCIDQIKRTQRRETKAKL